jgi:hypothetical protein
LERHVLVFTVLSKRRVEIPLCGCVAVGQIGPLLLLKRQQAAFSACFLHCHGLRASRRLLPQSRHTNRCSAISESANVNSHADRQDRPRVTLTVVRPTTDSTKGDGFVRCVSILQNKHSCDFWSCENRGHGGASLSNLLRHLSASMCVRTQLAELHGFSLFFGSHKRSPPPRSI